MSKNVILLDSTKEQLAPATTAEQVRWDADTNLKQKINKLILGGSTEVDLSEIESKIETLSREKANVSDTYTKAEVDSKVSSSTDLGLVEVSSEEGSIEGDV